jgi:NDP-sugar pyrophosphorylase family protein
MGKDIAIVFMCAGISSRFGGKIKQFAQVGSNGETLMECSLNQALKAGFTRIFFIVGDKTERPFKEKFGDLYKKIPVSYFLQKFDTSARDRPWGTADAVCSINSIDCPFVVCNSDDIYGEYAFKILADHLRSSNECAVIGYRLADALPYNLGANRAIFKKDSKNYALDLREVFNILRSNLSATGNSPEDLCSMSIYALHGDMLNDLKEIVEEFKRNHVGDRKIECLMPDSIGRLIRENKIKVKIYPARDKPLGITCPEDEKIVKAQLAELKTTN